MKRISILVLLAAVVAIPSGCNGGAPKGGKSLSQQFQDALKIADAGQRARKMAQVAESQHAAGDILGMGSSLSAAKEAALSVKDASSKATTLIYVAGAYARLEQSKEEIKSLLKEAGAAIGGIADPDARVPVLSDLAAATGTHLKNPAAAEAHLKTAEEAAEQIDGSVTKVTALTKIATAYGKLKSAEEAARVLAAATEFARARTDAREKCDCLAEVALALAGMQRAEESNAMFGEAQQAASEISDAENQGYALLNVAQKATTAKNKKLASSLLDQAAAAADKVTDSGARAPLQQEISGARKSL